MERFRERRANNDGSYFLLLYDGEPVDINEDERGEIDRRLRMFMDNKEAHADMIKNVSFIRTIFIDYDEKYIYMKYHDKEKDEFVEYRDKELTVYECKYQDLGKKKGKSSQKAYKQKADISIKLKDIGPIGVGLDEYKLIDCFNYFYNTHPNFSNKQTFILFQCMMQILKKFDIEIIELNDFIYDSELGINTSFELEQKVSNLFPYGMIKTVGKGEISDLENKIRIIGNTINDSIEGIHRFQGLLNVTKLLCPSIKEEDAINNIKEMNENFHNLELVKKINSELK